MSDITTFYLSSQVRLSRILNTYSPDLLLFIKYAKKHVFVTHLC